MSIAAEWIAWGLGKGTEKTGVLLKKGSSALRDQIKPEEEEKKVDPATQKGIYYARQATSGAVKVSAFIGMFFELRRVYESHLNHVFVFLIFKADDS